MVFIDTHLGSGSGSEFRRSPTGAVLSTQKVPPESLLLVRKCSGGIRRFGCAIFGRMGPEWRYNLFVALDVAAERWDKYGPPPNLERVAAEVSVPICLYDTAWAGGGGGNSQLSGFHD